MAEAKTAKTKLKKENVNREVIIDKVVVNICVGNDKQKMDKSKLLLEKITGKNPSICTAKRRLATWQIRPGLPIGHKVTLRYEDAENFLKWLLEYKKNVLKSSSIDRFGNFCYWC